MTAWIARVNIYGIINRDDDGSPQAVLETAKMIQEEVKKDALANIRLGASVRRMVEKTQRAVEAEMDYDDCCNVFNGALNTVYDVADRERIWTAG